jgi:outer membrane receptor for monomeric catechols
VTVDDRPKAERSNYYDFGVTHQVNKDWQVGMEAYYKSMRNVADEAQVGDSLIYTPFSYDYGYYVGTELTSSYSRDGFSAFTNLEINQSKARDLNSSQFLFGQDELDYTAQHDVHLNHDQFITLSAGASYTFMDTTVHIDTIYGSGFYDGFADLDKVAAHYPVDFGVEHDFKLANSQELTLRCDVINLFDESYVYHHGSGIGTTAPYYGERRGVFFGVSFKF